MTSNFLSNTKKIQEVVQNANSQQLIFFKRRKSGYTSNYEAYNFELDQNSIGDSLKNIVISSIERNSNYKLKTYTINLDSDEKNVIYEMPSDSVCNFNKIQNAMLDGTIDRINVALAEEIDPNFYILNFDNGDEQVMAITHYSPATTFKGKLIFKNQAEIYEECLSILHSVHCLYYKLNSEDENFIENIVIFNNSRSSFERVFDYKEEYRTKATLTIKELADSNLISNVDVFKSKTMDDEYFVRKLAKINLENKIDIVKNNFKDLIKANNDFQELRVEIDEKTKTIIIPYNVEKDYIKRVLSLLNTEPMENLISKAKVLVSDNNNPIQQKLHLV